MGLVREPGDVADLDQQPCGSGGSDAVQAQQARSGVPYELGVQAAQEFGSITALQGATSAQRALRWLIDQPGITTVIPGASSPAQATKNAQAADQASLSPVQLEKVTALYNDKIRGHVHARW